MYSEWQNFNDVVVYVDDGLHYIGNSCYAMQSIKFRYTCKNE